MLRYTLRRLSFLPIILLAVSILTFWALRVLPTGDIADVIGGSNATAAQKEAIRAQYGLTKPIFPVTVSADPPFIAFHKDSQYGTWLVDALQGNFGKQYSNGVSVRDEFARRFLPGRCGKPHPSPRKHPTHRQTKHSPRSRFLHRSND